eukprot:jgi/Chlat1/4619/Chrsp293S04360
MAAAEPGNNEDQRWRRARSARTARRKSPPAIPAVAKRQRTASSSSAGRARTVSDASQSRSPSPPSPRSPPPAVAPSLVSSPPSPLLAADDARATTPSPAAATAATPVIPIPAPHSPTPSESDNDDDVDQFAQYGYSSSFSGTETDVSDEEVARSDCTGRPLFEGIIARGSNASHRKRPLDPDWKRYRRGIEWRCRWLELRMAELRALTQHYEEELAQMQSRDEECTAAGSQDNEHPTLPATPSGTHGKAAGCDPQSAGNASALPNQRQYKRRRREQPLPETAPRNHPLFSRLDKTVGRRQRVQEDSQDLAAATTATAGSGGSLPQISIKGTSQQRKPAPSPEQQHTNGIAHHAPPNPMEELCDQIDAVQQRVEVLLYQLQQHKASQGS